MAVKTNGKNYFSLDFDGFFLKNTFGVAIRSSLFLFLTRCYSICLLWIDYQSIPEFFFFVFFVLFT